MYFRGKKEVDDLLQSHELIFFDARQFSKLEFVCNKKKCDALFFGS
jgi:hypothetical protein